MNPELSSYPGYFQEPHWISMGLLEITRVTLQVWNHEPYVYFLRKYCTNYKYSIVFIAIIQLNAVCSPLLRPSDTYMCRRAGSSLVQVMDCHMFCTKPLPEPMLIDGQFDAQESSSVKLKSKFHCRKCNSKCYLQNGSHFVWPLWINLCPEEFFMASVICTSVSPSSICQPLYRSDSRLTPSQWEMLLQCNTVSHWLGENLESALL